MPFKKFANLLGEFSRSLLGATWLREGERRFVRNVAVVMGGRGFAFALTTLSTPLIARLYLPSDYGLAAVLLSLAAVLAPVTCGSYERAIPVARQSGDLASLVLICVICMMVTAFVISPLVIWMTLNGFVPLAVHQAGLWLLLIPMVVLFHGLAMISVNCVIREKGFPQIAAGELLQSGARTGSRLLAGFAIGSTVGALLLSHILGLISKTYTACRFLAQNKTSESLAIWGSRKRLLATARIYSDFPKFSMPNGALILLSAQLPIFVLGNVFGVSVAGFFAIADRLVRAPINLASDSLRQVIVRQYAETIDSGRLIYTQLLRTVFSLALLGVMPFFLLWMYGAEIIHILLGEAWSPAGRFVELLAPYCATVFLGAPFQAAAVASRMQRLWFRLEMFTVIGRAAVIPVSAIDSATPEDVLVVYVWVTIVTKLVTFWTVFWVLPKVKKPQLD